MVSLITVHKVVSETLSLEHICAAASQDMSFKWDLIQYVKVNLFTLFHNID